MTKPVILMILDGWGDAPDSEHNAVTRANTPNFDHLSSTAPGGLLNAHGTAVGLPEGQMGNSEVGHTTIGAGRVIWMDLPKINNAIQDKSLFKNERLNSGLASIKANKGRCHILGLVSEGGVHAHSAHITALVKAAEIQNIEVVLHLFTDGRDVSPNDAQKHLPQILPQIKHAKIGSLIGRFFAMDRDNRWERVEKAYQAIAMGRSDHNALTVEEALSNAYARGESDEFLSPTVVGDYDGIKDGDGFICVNFRSDRIRELLDALVMPDFNEFERRPIKWSSKLGMVPYSDKLEQHLTTLFPKDKITNTLGEYASKNNLTQFHIAETEKYPHVTFFLNGGEEAAFTGEMRYMAESPKVKTYDLKPEMSAKEVGDHLEEAILSKQYDLIICNFANPDMVGHTGIFEAAKKAVEAVDVELGRAMKATTKTQGVMFVTADHGNCETMWDVQTNEPHTAHTLNPVQYRIWGFEGNTQPMGGLNDIAPTLLKLLSLEKPSEMTGKCLIY